MFVEKPGALIKRFDKSKKIKNNKIFFAYEGFIMQLHRHKIL